MKLSDVFLGRYLKMLVYSPNRDLAESLQRELNTPSSFKSIEPIEQNLLLRTYFSSQFYPVKTEPNEIYVFPVVTHEDDLLLLCALIGHNDTKVFAIPARAPSRGLTSVPFDAVQRLAKYINELKKRNFFLERKEDS